MCQTLLNCCRGKMFNIYIDGYLAGEYEKLGDAREIKLRCLSVKIPCRIIET